MNPFYFDEEDHAKTPDEAVSFWKKHARDQVRFELFRNTAQEIRSLPETPHPLGADF